MSVVRSRAKWRIACEARELNSEVQRLYRWHEARRRQRELERRDAWESRRWQEAQDCTTALMLCAWLRYLGATEARSVTELCARMRVSEDRLRSAVEYARVRLLVHREVALWNGEERVHLAYE